MNAQIVSVPGINNGDELMRTIKDLYTLYPQVSDVAVVPIGITKFRQGLKQVKTYTKQQSIEEIERVKELQDKYIKEIGEPFVRLSYEFYLVAGKEIPNQEFYDDYHQIEDGIGMVRCFRDAIDDTLNDLDENMKGSFSIVTGTLAYPELLEVSLKIKDKNPNIKLDVYAIINNYFGPTITIAGLLTGTDIIDPIKVTFIGTMIISFFSLFFLNGFNKKTFSSLISVILVITLVMLITYKMGINAQIQGFSNEQIDLVSFYSLYVQIDFSKIVICGILIGLLGAVIDVSISSSMNEIYKSNSLITQHELFKSGMNIGKDILGTMTNILFFAYISGFMTLMIYFNQLNYSLSTIINGKVFCSEVFQSICCGIGIILIIPITAFITSKLLFLLR